MATLTRDMDLAAHLDAAPAKRVARRFDDEGGHRPAAAPRFDPPSDSGETRPS
jgi:hypothetical protein